MPLMCETCKCSVVGDEGCDNGCPCCNQEETIEIIFCTKQYYSMTLPKNHNYDLEDLYNKYWWGDLPDDVEVYEQDIDHEWVN